MENLRSFSEDYFRSINPIAKRICEDIRSTQENYETAWSYLSHEEQNQVINESLIYPDAVLKYSLVNGEEPKLASPKSCLILKNSYGCKILQDETGVDWRDEHSAPFSWKTSSQLFDICSFTNPSSNQEANQVSKKKKPPVPPPKPPKPVALKNTFENNTENLEQPDLLQPNFTAHENEFSSINSQVLPKTGCEFLDNW